MYFGGKSLHSLARLFKFDTVAAKAWDSYWFSGIRNLNQEMKIYEIVTQAGQLEHGRPVPNQYSITTNE